MQSEQVNQIFVQYVNKGHDRVTAAFYQSRSNDQGVQIRDEIKMYYDCRYLSACEATWRIFGFDIHYRDPPVARLAFHLPNSHNLVFNDNQLLESVLNKPSATKTIFLAWFEANKEYPEARNIRYVDFSQSFVFKKDAYKWVPKKKGFSIGKIMHVRPGKGDD